jgi:hypothetical protein
VAEKGSIAKEKRKEKKEQRVAQRCRALFWQNAPYGELICTALERKENEKEQFMDGNTGNNAGIRNDGCWLR